VTEGEHTHTADPDAARALTREGEIATELATERSRLTADLGGQPHVALRVRRVVERPVRDGRAGDARLEDVRPPLEALRREASERIVARVAESREESCKSAAGRRAVMMMQE
jgi:hypothetical protein